MAATRPGRPTWPERALFAFLLLLALAILGAALGLISSIAGYRDLDQETTGTVTAQQRGETCTSTVSYDVDLVDYETRFDDCPGVGDVVTVRYDAADPGGGTAAGTWRVYVAYPILVVCFLGLVVVLVVAGYREWRRIRADPRAGRRSPPSHRADQPR